MIRPRLSLLILALLACSRDKKPESSGMATTTDSLMPSETAAAPAEAPAAAAHEPMTPYRVRGRMVVRADTTRFIDSVRVGDTVSYKRGYRVLITVIDSTWSRRPPLALGIPNGPFHLPLDSLCQQQSVGYNGATLNANAPTLLRDLERVKRCHGRVIIGVLRSHLRPPGVDSGFTVARAKAEIDSWPDIGPYIRDTTIIAIYMADDLSSPEWGQAGMAERLARWDSIYALVQAPSRWPGVATAMRAKPNELRDWGWKGTHLTTAWAQYRGPYRDGPPKRWTDEMVASAKAQKLGIIIGLNLLDGGCGPPVLPKGKANTDCLPNVPGSPILGTYENSADARRFQVSPAEYLFYKTVFLSEPYNCASIDWQWSPVWKANRPSDQLTGAQMFHTRSEVKASAKALGVIARTRPYTSCIQR